MKQHSAQDHPALSAVCSRIVCSNTAPHPTLCCHAVVHVLDAVLLPTRTIQQVVPSNVAVDRGSAASNTIGGGGGSSGGPLAGLTGSGGSGSSSTASPTSPSAAAGSFEAATRSSPQQAASAPPAAQAAASQRGCVRSIAAAIDASPQLTIDKTIAFLAGWDFSHPGLNVTLFLPSGWLLSCPCRPPHQPSHAWSHAFTTPWRCRSAMRLAACACPAACLLPAPSMSSPCRLKETVSLPALPSCPAFLDSATPCNCAPSCRLSAADGAGQPDAVGRRHRQPGARQGGCLLGTTCDAFPMEPAPAWVVPRNMCSSQIRSSSSCLLTSCPTYC